MKKLIDDKHYDVIYAPTDESTHHIPEYQVGEQYSVVGSLVNRYPLLFQVVEKTPARKRSDKKSEAQEVENNG